MSDGTALAGDALRGSCLSLVTPLRDGIVDVDAYQKLVQMQVDGGSQGIVVTGTSGEPSTLTAEERVNLLRVAVDIATGRISVVAATGSQSHAETVWLCEQAQVAGVYALLVSMPSYVKPLLRGLVEYFVDVCSRFDLAVLLYHIPGRAAVALTVDTVDELSDRAQNLVGIKHAVNGLAFVSSALVRRGQDFRIFVGLEESSCPEVAIDAAGLMNAVGNVAPDRVVERGDLHGVRRLHYELLELNETVFYDTNPIPIKYMQRPIGILPTNEHWLPMVPASPELERRLDGVLARAGLL